MTGLGWPPMVFHENLSTG